MCYHNFMNNTYAPKAEEWRKQQRQLALDKYYANPKFCGFCQQVISIGEKETSSYVRTKTYCGLSCLSKATAARGLRKNNRVPMYGAIKGSEISNKFQHDRAVASYENDPAFCMYCKKKLELNPNGRPGETKRNCFCNPSCGALYRWHGIKSNLNWPENSPLTTVAKKDTKPEHIRSHARKVWKSLNINVGCAMCGYNKNLEVAHIDSVLSFSDETLIGVINHPNNLIALCANCHLEYDKGDISVATIKEKVAERFLSSSTSNLELVA